jgi:molecular chaperone DnaK
MPKAVGLDLGTTNSVVSVFEAGAPTVIPNPVEADLAELNSALAGSDLALQATSERLTNATQALTERLYCEAAAAHQGPAGGAASAGSDDEIVDSEVVDGGGR